MSSSAIPAAVDATARVQFSDKFHLWLDEPADWSGKLRRLRLSGWCVAKRGAPLVAIRACIGGKTFDGEFDRERSEVAGYLGMPDAPRWCGFTVDVQIPFGRKRLELQVAAADGKWRKAFARNVTGPLVVGKTERALWQKIEEADAQKRFAFFLSRPADWEKPMRELCIEGWCIDRTGSWIHGIRAVIGRRTFTGTYGINRPDVAALFGDNDAARRSGLAIAAEVPPGMCLVELQARSVDGVWRPVFSREVCGASVEPKDEAAPTQASYSEATAPRFQFWFDRPSDWSQPTRHLHVSGWCLTLWGEPVAELRARVGRKVFRANYGILRPDVAATFNTGTAALKSGFSLDAEVPWGSSRFVLEARSDGGSWEQVFTAPVRGPLLWNRRRDEDEAIGKYAEWIRRYDRMTRRDADVIRQQTALLVRTSKISVLLPAYNTNAKWLRRAIESVRAQLYPHWELCVVDDASTESHVWRILQSYRRHDSRIKVSRRSTNGHIAAASNDALQMASGKFVALLDHDDELAPPALYLVARAINENPDARLFYSDEDKLDKQGRRCDPYFKPAWNPDLLRSQNYVSHLSVYDIELVRKVGGFRIGFEGSQDYDLTLRCAEQIGAAQIHHIPHVLYHWRIADESTATFAAAKPYAYDAAIRAVQDHMDRRRVPARVEPHYANYLRVIYAPPADQPLVSIVIPTRDRAALLRQCIDSIVGKTGYRKFEIIIVDNESREAETLDYLRSLSEAGQARVVAVAGDFNYSKLNNIGVAHARGEFIALMNNDLEVMNADWLAEMVSHAARPEIGAVGARLWYPDGVMQHGGVILGVGGVAAHAHVGIRKEHGYFGRAHLTQDFSAVTGACMVLRKEVYQQLGGLDEVNLAIAFNDVDFCLRLAAAGLRVVWTPHAELVHHESASRGLEDTGAKQRRFLAEVAFMQEKWRHVLEADPFYNPNLSIESNQQFKLAFPPRVAKPWRDNPVGTTS